MILIAYAALAAIVVVIVGHWEHAWERPRANQLPAAEKKDAERIFTTQFVVFYFSTGLIYLLCKHGPSPFALKRGALLCAAVLAIGSLRAALLPGHARRLWLMATKSEKEELAKLSTARRAATLLVLALELAAIGTVGVWISPRKTEPLPAKDAEAIAPDENRAIDILVSAIRDRRHTTIWYRDKDGDALRNVRPLVIGKNPNTGNCLLRVWEIDKDKKNTSGYRAYRLDRIVAARPIDGTVPFDVTPHDVTPDKIVPEILYAAKITQPAPETPPEL